MDKRKQFIEKTKDMLVVDVVEEKRKSGGGKRGRVSFTELADRD